MPLRSRGLRTDLAMLDAEYIERDGYLVVRSPAEPSFYWGNLLVFSRPPGPGDLELWQAAFEKEFSPYPAVRHRTFTWDLSSASGDDDEISRFAQAGYHHERTVVLTADAVQPPPHPNTAVDIRELSTDSEWDDALLVQLSCREKEHSEEAYRAYLVQRMAVYRDRSQRGEGAWYGAYLDDKQVANLGLYRAGELGRFQSVVTLESTRRQGLCGTLVHHVAKSALERPEVEALVMLADETYHAARIYESVGFAASEHLQGLCLWPQDAKAS